MSVSRAEPDQTPRSAASDLVLHCFLMSHKKDVTRLTWVNFNYIGQVGKSACINNTWTRQGN